MAAKTERPTARRLRRAIHEGDVAYSSVLVRTIALCAAALALPAAAHAARERFVERLRATLATGIAPSAGNVLWDVLTLSAPFLAVAATAAFATGLLQTRGAVVFAPSRSRSKADAPIRLIDTRQAAGALLGAAVVVAVAMATIGALRSMAPEILKTLAHAGRAFDVVSNLLSRLGLTVLVILVGASVLDYLMEHAAWLGRLRMSRREVDEERREQEGDPAVRRARRRAHEALLPETRP